MSLTVTLRKRVERPARLEIHREQIGAIAHVHVIAYTARPVEWSIGFTTAQAAQLAAALAASLPAGALMEALGVIGFTIVRVEDGRPAGALGNNTDTDSHPGARYERQGDCRLSAEPMLPLGGVQ